MTERGPSQARLPHKPWLAPGLVLSFHFLSTVKWKESLKLSLVGWSFHYSLSDSPRDLKTRYTLKGPHLHILTQTPGSVEDGLCSKTLLPQYSEARTLETLVLKGLALL